MKAWIWLNYWLSFKSVETSNGRANSELAVPITRIATIQ